MLTYGLTVVGAREGLYTFCCSRSTPCYVIFAYAERHLGVTVVKKVDEVECPYQGELHHVLVVVEEQG